MAGNMYPWIDESKNPIRGICPHGCSYCLMRPMHDRMKGPRLEKSELKKPWPEDKFLYIGSSMDMWADEIDSKDIKAVIEKCQEHPGNRYLFQSKNPVRFLDFKPGFIDVLYCTTLESDLDYFEGPPHIDARVNGLAKVQQAGYWVTVTIEPIMRFELNRFKEMVLDLRPDFVSIGADSQGHNLPEPTSEEIQALIRELRKGTEVRLKSNLTRILGA